MVKEDHATLGKERSKFLGIRTVELVGAPSVGSFARKYIGHRIKNCGSGPLRYDMLGEHLEESFPLATGSCGGSDRLGKLAGIHRRKRIVYRVG